MVLEYSPDGNLLYVRLRPGEVAETAELEENVYVDLDADGRPVGVEFVDADGLFPFLRRLAGQTEDVIVNVPDTVRVLLDERFDVAATDGLVASEAVLAGPATAYPAGA